MKKYLVNILNTPFELDIDDENEIQLYQNTVSSKKRYLRLVK